MRFKIIGRSVFTGRVLSFALGIGLLGLPASGNADSLHVFCWGTTSCSSNGTPNLQTSTNPPQFGITDTGKGVTPGTTTGKYGSTTTVTDDLVVDILDPNSISQPSSLSPFAVTITSTATTVDSTNPTQATAFTGPGGAKLSAYLAGAGTDNFNSNPFSSITLLSPATGFWVYQVDLGQQALGNNQDFKLSVSPLDQGSVILAFLTATTATNTCDKHGNCVAGSSTDYTSTANSEMLFEDGLPPTINHFGATPLPATLPLFAGGLGVVGLLGVRRKRKAQAA